MFWLRERESFRGFEEDTRSDVQTYRNSLSSFISSRKFNCHIPFPKMRMDGTVVSLAPVENFPTPMERSCATWREPGGHRAGSDAMRMEERERTRLWEFTHGMLLQTVPRGNPADFLPELVERVAGQYAKLLGNTGLCVR